MSSASPMTVVYYVWLTSDFCYFVGDRLEAMASRLGFSIDYRPVRLFDVYDLTGGIRLKFRPEQRKAYRVAELNRWSKRLGMPINANAKYSGADDDLASCVILAAKRRGLPLAPLLNAYLRAVWVEDRDIADADTLIEITNRIGYDGRDLIAEADDPMLRKDYDDTVGRAVDDGVFGAPFFIFRGEPFWGQDRLDFLEETILRAKAAG